MQIQENIKLAPFTTFKIGGEARYFCEVKDQFDALTAFEFAKEKNLPIFVLGGGSNVLVSESGFKGLVIRVVNRGIEIMGEGNYNNNYNNNENHKDNYNGNSSDEQTILLKVASGENWDSVVEFSVKNNWWGMENLSHIPGSTGAIAVQNVGAYGQEAKNIIESVTVFDKDTHQILSLTNEQCGFSYRSSIFNTVAKGKYIIFEILFRLSKNPKPILGYRDLKEKFQLSPNLSHQNENEKLLQPLLANIRQAIIAIRNKKFPFPVVAKNGNAGSFFKNTVVDSDAYQKLEQKLLDAFGAEAVNNLQTKKFIDGGNIKIPTAFLLDICGLKDLQTGGAAINHNQPLVIINKTGTATANEVLNLATQVIDTVKDKCGISLQIEPELVGFLPDDLAKLKSVL